MLLWAIVLLIPWLFLFGLEALLRLSGYGVSMDFVLHREVAGEARLLSNPRFTWRFFEPAAARLLPPFSLLPRKPEKTCRIFVLGGSAAQGDPEPGFGLARMLEVLLSERHPGVDFEVVNAAPTAVNSHVVHAMARAALGLEPDALVVYSGNNEVVGPFGAGTVLTQRAPSLGLLRAGVSLRGSRLGQFTGGAVRWLGSGDAPPQQAWRGMEMFVERQLRHSDPSLDRTYEHYERNLADVCRAAQGAGVPVVLSTLAVNLRSWGPFGSLHAEGLSASDLERWEELFAEGRGLELEERFEEALVRYGAAASIDGEHAELSFRMGRCASGLGRRQEAEGRFSRARDLDTLRFRADTRLAEIVRGVVEEAGDGVLLADAAGRLAAQAPDGIPGSETFLDHVHFTFAGNYRLGVALLGPLEKALPAWVRERASNRALPSQVDCERRLVFTELDRYMLAETMLKRLGQPPFTGQPDHAEHQQRFREELDSLRASGGAAAVEVVVREYQAALAEPATHWRVRERYATIEHRSGQHAIAEREWRRLARDLPQYPSFHLQLARSLRAGSKLAEAEAALGQALEYQPESSELLLEQAALVHLQGRSDEAVALLERVLEIEPGMPDAHESLGLLYRVLGQHEWALHHLEAALSADPDRPRAQRALEELRRR